MIKYTKGKSMKESPAANQTFVRDLIFEKYPDCLNAIIELQKQIEEISNLEKVDLSITIDSTGKKRNIGVYNGEEIYYEFGSTNVFSKG